MPKQHRYKSHTVGLWSDWGSPSAGDFERPGISGAGDLEIWGSRDLELWSSPVMPKQHRYKSHTVGLWRDWGSPSVGNFERPGISSAGDRKIWGSRDLELWSSPVTPNQHGYRPRRVGLCRDWGSPSVGDFERPGISSAGDLEIWGSRDLELWSSPVMPKQHRYKSHTVGLCRDWGSPSAGDFERPGISSAGDLEIWGSRDLELTHCGTVERLGISKCWGFRESGELKCWGSGDLGISGSGALEFSCDAKSA